MDERLQVYESKMTKSFDALGRDLAAIRAGRANPHVLDKIKVDYYGTPTRCSRLEIFLFRRQESSRFSRGKRK